MNILLINHYAGSPTHGMEYRPYYMAKKWMESGHNVTIVASSHSHLRSKSPKISNVLTGEVIDGIRYIWIKSPVYNGNGIGRISNMLTFVGRILQYRKSISDEVAPDVVIASSTYPLDILPVYFIAKENHAKQVFEVHDLWPLSPMELGNMSRWHPFIMVMQWAENFAYRTSDAVISMLPKADQHMISHGMDPDKFSYIPNGVDIEDWERQSSLIPELHRSVLEEIRRKGHFVVGYAGAHGVANALDSLIDAAKLLKNTPVSFVLVGQGPEKDKLIRMVEKAELENVKFLPAVSKTSIPQLFSLIDALYIGLQRQPLFRFGVSPNKLMDYMMAAKPVIYAIEAGNDLVRESNCGISIPPENPGAIAQAINHLLSMDEDALKEMGLRGRDYICRNHDYRTLATKFLDVLRTK